MQVYDVMVVGAGLAGLQLARLTAQSGLKTLLIDRRTRLDQSIRTTGIFVRRSLEDFSFPDHCLGPPIRHVQLYSPARRCLKISSPRTEFRIGRIQPLYRAMLASAIRSGADWWEAARFLSSTPSGGGSRVCVLRNGKRESVQTDYLVGADGCCSHVARSLGLGRNREWIVGVEEVYQGCVCEGPPQLFCYLDPRLAPGYLAWIAHDGHETHLGVGGYPARFAPRHALHQFRQEVAPMLGLDRARRIETRGGRIPVGGLRSRIIDTRGLLVGDAAGAVSPLTAGGLDSCLRQSTLAAQVIRSYLTSRDTATLAAYDSERFRKRFRKRYWMRRLLAQIHSPWMAESAMCAIRLPLLRSVACQVFFGRGSFPIESREWSAECGVLG